jgi:hydroxypyruvate isomerase
MKNDQRLTRRALLQQMALGCGALAFAQNPPPQDYVLDKKHLVPLKLKGRIKQSAARGAYRRVKIEDLCQAAKAMGLVGLDLVNNREEWAVLKKYGLQATMVSGAGSIPDAFNRKENHDKLVETFRGNAQAASQAGWKNVISFSGNRKGQPDN